MNLLLLLLLLLQGCVNPWKEFLVQCLKHRLVGLNRSCKGRLSSMMIKIAGENPHGS